MIKSIVIKEPFYGAGSPKQYNWTKDGYHIHGIGVDKQLLDHYDELRITVGSQTTTVKSAAIKAFADRYNSYRPIKNSFVTVAVFSRSLLGDKAVNLADLLE